MAIVFKYAPIGKAQSAQQIGDWFSPVKQQLDDYFAAITDDLIPIEILPTYRADYKAAKYAEQLAKIEREKRLAEQGLKFAERASQLSPEQIAKINYASADKAGKRKPSTNPTPNRATAPVSVLSTQPQYEGKSSVEAAPPSGVNLSADGIRVVTSAGGGGSPPFKPPSESTNFDAGNNNYGRTFGQYPQGESPEQLPLPGVNEFVEAQAFKQAQDAANSGNYFENLWNGTKRGFKYSVDASKYSGRSASAVWNRAPQAQYDYLQPEGRVGFGVGRVAGDVIGNGSRQVLWNLHPADFVGTHGSKMLGEDASRMAKVVIPFAAVTGLELGSQIYNPLNLGEGGRVAGYSAINPDDEDPRISTTPVSELLIDRGFLGKRGRLLPWEQFRQERTDIPYEQYEKYQDYLRNKDENFLRDATGGLIKGTMDGINGPELSVMGYSVTPTGALAAGAALLAGRELVKSGRIAAFRK